MSIKQKIESLLFVSASPLTVEKISKITKEKTGDVKDTLEKIVVEYDEKKGGIVVVRDGKKFQMMTAPETSEFITEYLHEDLTGELTKPSLETLTIIAYRQPVTKAEIEMIRGINCSLILRNLLIRGLIESEENKKTKLVSYRLTFDFMQQLGVKEVTELPDYEKLNKDINLEELLNPENKQENNEK